jgi:hypothetical protein
MSKVLVIGDAHVDEEQLANGQLDRFLALGKKIVAEKPAYVVIIGDFLSLNCLSAWDRNKRQKMEGLRYYKELEAGNYALDLLMKPINDYNVRCKKSKVGGYNPKWVYISGNHEDRLARYLETDPTFLGTVSISKDLALASRGFVFVEYKDVYNIGGVSFTHVPISGIGKAISNPTVTQKALKLFANSVVFGHTHTLDHCAEHRHGADHLNQALSVGCFFYHVDDYARGSKTDYWRGVVTLNIYSDNRFDIETQSLSSLMEQYK